MAKSKSRRKFLCLDCGVDTGKINEHYFIKTDLWLSVVGSKKGMLCVNCLQNRLKRPLVKSDFTNSYINSPRFEPKSQRLMEIFRS